MQDNDLDIDVGFSQGEPQIENEIMHPILPDPLIPLQPSEPIDIVIIKFRKYFNEIKITDEQILIYKNIAQNLISRERWGNMYYYGLCLLIAHFFTLKLMYVNEDGEQDLDANKSVASKSVGSVNISYNSNASADNNSFYDTVYGKEYLTLLAIYGVGAYQL